MESDCEELDYDFDTPQKPSRTSKKAFADNNQGKQREGEGAAAKANATDKDDGKVKKAIDNNDVEEELYGDIVSPGGGSGGGASGGGGGGRGSPSLCTWTYSAERGPVARGNAGPGPEASNVDLSHRRSLGVYINVRDCSEIIRSLGRINDTALSLRSWRGTSKTDWRHSASPRGIL